MNFRDIWNRFLEFESNIGDLSSILKVEKRRSAVLGKVIYKNYIYIDNFKYQILLVTVILFIIERYPLFRGKMFF